MPNTEPATLAEAIVETVQLPLLALDGDLRVETANDAFLTHFGVSRSETLGRRVYELGNGQWDIPELRRLLGEILPRESTVSDYRVEHRFERIGRRIMKLNARRIVREGAPDLILLAISDETEREALRTELIARIEFADKLTESVREGLLILEPDLRVHSASGSFYDMFGVESGGTVGRRIYELGNGQWDIPALRLLLEDILPRQRSFDDFEVVHTFESIGRRVMVLNGRRLDHLNLILLAIRDVTDLRNNELRLRDVTEAAGIGVWEEDFVTGRAYWSPELRKLFGDPPDQPPAGMPVPDRAHADDRPELARALKAAAEPSSDGVINHEFRIVRTDGAVRWVRIEGHVEFEDGTGAQQPVRSRGILFDVTESRAAQAALRANEERQTYLLALSDALRPLTDPFDVMETASRLLGERLGADQVAYAEIDLAAGIGVIHRDWNAGTIPSNAGRHALSDFGRFWDDLGRGETVVIPDVSRDPRTSTPEALSSFTKVNLSALIDVPLVKDGCLQAMLAVHCKTPRPWSDNDVAMARETVERTWAAVERARAERQRDFLMQEVNHRAKNMLSLVLAMAGASLRDSSGDFMESFRQRVSALAANQDLLVSRRWRGVMVHDLVRTQLAHFSDLIDARIMIEGPSLVISSKASETLAMVLHELATNAGKYGSLSGLDGRVEIRWNLESDQERGQRFRASWREVDGPLVMPPTRKGFGMRVVRDMAQMNLKADVRLAYEASGLVWELDAPAQTCLETTAPGRDRGQAKQAAVKAGGPAANTGGPSRILIVEDEGLIGIELAEGLRAHGHVVVGPAGSVEAGLALLARNGCDAAVIDVNLGGETSEPVAEALTQRGIPFVVVTGYSPNQLSPILKAAPVFAKPVQIKQLLPVLARSLR